MFKRERPPFLSKQEQPPFEEADFENFGGRVIDRDEEGRPTNWVPGLTEHGDFVHPPGTPDRVIPYLATCKENEGQPQWRAAVPEHPEVADRHEWR